MDKVPVVAVTRIIPEAGMTLLQEAADRGEIELRIWTGELPPESARFEELVSGCDGVLTLLTERIDAELLSQHPDLKVVSNFAVGFDNIDVPAATSRGVIVCNTPGVLTETTADMVWALLMSAARRIVEGVDYVRAGKWLTWGPTLLLGQDVHHATLGIVGFGRIGQEVAKRAAGFDMKVILYDAFPDQAAATKFNATFVELDELLAQSDFVSLNCTLTPETYQLIGRDELAVMKPTAILINAARGPVVDTMALVHALKTGEIAAAAVDVTDPEPLPADHPLIGLPNAIVVPHIASATVATRNKMAMMAATNLLEGVAGRRPPHVVNPEVFEKT